MSVTDVEQQAGTRSASRTDEPQNPKRWWILGALSIAQLMVVLDTTVVNIALPSAQKDLGFGNTDRQWIVTAYALAFGSLLLLGGRLADMVGRKKIFMIGLTGFAAASAVAGAATGFEMLVGARAVQGAFGALLAPVALSLLTTTFTDRKERARAFGIFSAIAGGGAAVGLLLGGVLTEYLSWRWCMYVNLVFAALALAGGAAWLRDRKEETQSKLDIPGIVLVTSGLFGLVYGFSHAETAGWENGVTIGCIAAGVALLTAFVWVEAKVSNPAMPLRVVLDRNRGGSYIAFFVSGAGMFAVFLFLTYYLQQSLNFSAVKSGLAFMPLTATLVVVSQIGINVVARRVAPRYIIATGLAMQAGSLWMLTLLDIDSSYAANVLPATLLFGAGVGLVFSSALSNATSGLKAEDAGVASAMVNTGQQIGGSLGTALLSTLAASAATDYASSHPAGPSLKAMATIHSYTTAFGWAAVILAVGAVVTAVVLSPKVPEVDENAEEMVVV